MHILDLPDTKHELAQWLEQRIVRGELGEFSAESEAAGPLDPSVTLSFLAPAELSQVLSHGLSVLSEEHLRRLAGEPGLLFLLQDRILESGGSYWTELANQETSSDTRNETLGFLQRSLPAATTAVVSSTQTNRVRRVSGRTLMTFAAVASLMLAAGLGIFLNGPGDIGASRSASVGWGWKNSSALTAAIPADAYLNQLADAATEWFRIRPDSKDQLAKRLTEFRDGCDILLSAEHAQLSVADRQWLLDRCRVWRSEIEQHLADVQTEAALASVLESSDRMVNGLITELKLRAETV